MKWTLQASGIYPNEWSNACCEIYNLLDVGCHCFSSKNVQKISESQKLTARAHDVERRVCASASKRMSKLLGAWEPSWTKEMAKTNVYSSSPFTIDRAHVNFPATGLWRFNLELVVWAQIMKRTDRWLHIAHTQRIHSLMQIQEAFSCFVMHVSIFTCLFLWSSFTRPCLDRVFPWKSFDSAES